MKIFINHELFSFQEDQIELSDLLKTRNIKNELVLVLVNKKPVPHKERTGFVIIDQDEIDLIILVTGG